MLASSCRDGGVRTDGSCDTRRNVRKNERTAFSGTFDEQDTKHEEVQALRTELNESEKRLEETDQRLSALETKFDSFSHEPHEIDKRKEPARTTLYVASTVL